MTVFLAIPIERVHIGTLRFAGQWKCLKERLSFLGSAGIKDGRDRSYLGLERAAVTLEYERRGLHTDFLSGSVRNTTVSIKGIYFVQF